MNRRSVSENRLRSARAATTATADAVRSEIDGMIADFETALDSASGINSASERYIEVAFECGQAVAKLEDLKTNIDTTPNQLKDAEETVIAIKKRLDTHKRAFNTAEATLNRAYAEIESSFAAASAAFARFRESAQVTNRLVHKMVDVASSTKD